MRWGGVERVAIALCQNALGGKRCPCAESGVFKCADEHPGHQATAALSAMSPAGEVERAERRGAARAIDIVREIRDGFLSPEYATGQPMSSIEERFACNQAAEAIEQHYGLGTSEQCELLGKPTPAQIERGDYRYD